MLVIITKNIQISLVCLDQYNIEAFFSLIVNVFYSFSYPYRVALAESELAISESKVSDLSMILTRTKEDHDKMVKQIQTELKRERDVTI